MSLATSALHGHEESTASLEMRALEKMLRVLCEHTQQLVAAARERGLLGSREARLQAEAFAERCAQARQLLGAASGGVHETRLSRLEKLVEALHCSRDYFMNAGPG